MSLPKPYYQDQAVTIYHGDCREIVPELAGIDLVLTDPPYLAKNIGASRKPGLENGNLTPEKYREFCQAWFSACKEKTERIVFTPGVRHIWNYPEANWSLCWNKPGSVSFNAFGGFNGWEPILIYGKLPRGCRVSLDVLTYTPNNFGKAIESAHPCPRHYPLWQKVLGMISLEGETVLDPFVGSGTTLLAAKESKRKAIGIEFEEKYCELAARRLAQEILF